MKKQDQYFCCSHSKKSCVLFFTQSTAVGIVLFWSMYMLSQSTQDQNRDLYVSLLSASLGVFLPNPKISSGPDEALSEDMVQPMTRQNRENQYKLPPFPALPLPRNQTTTKEEEQDD